MRENKQLARVKPVVDWVCKLDPLSFMRFLNVIADKMSSGSSH